MGYYLPQLPGRSTMTMNSYMSNSHDAESGNGGLEEVKIPTIQGIVSIDYGILETELYFEKDFLRSFNWKLEIDQSQDTEPTYEEYNSEHLSQEPGNTGLVNPTFEEGKV